MPSEAAERLAEVSSLNFVAGPHWTDGHKQLAQRGFDRFAESREPPYRRSARRLLRRDFSHYARAAQTVLRDELGASPPGAKQIDEETIRRFIEEAEGIREQRAKEWIEQFRRLNERTTDIVVADINGELGLSLSIALPGLVEEINRRTEFLADQVQVNNYRAVVQQVQEGIDAGEHSRDIARRIRQIHDEGLFARIDEEGRFIPDDVDEGRRIQILSAQERANLIARTETTAMANGAAVRTVQESNVNKWKDWISQRDDRVRIHHNNSVGEDASDPVPLDENFPITGLPYPLGPNCRCTILFVDPPSKQ